MLHRIFLAINIPEPLKEEMLSFKEKLPEIPCKWILPENLHFTMIFLGNTSDNELGELLRISKEVAGRHRSFPIQLSRVQYGSSRNVPRMVWAMGEASTEILNLQKDLEKTLSASKTLHFIAEKRPFSLHLTLARLNEFELQTMEQDELPIIDQEVSWEIPVNSFEVMESKLNPGGVTYDIVESIPL